MLEDAGSIPASSTHKHTGMFPIRDVVCSRKRFSKMARHPVTGAGPSSSVAATKLRFEVPLRRGSSQAVSGWPRGA